MELRSTQATAIMSAVSALVGEGAGAERTARELLHAFVDPVRFDSIISLCKEWHLDEAVGILRAGVE